MKERRQFLKTALGVLAGAGVFITSWYSFLRPLWGEERKTILPKGTKRESLIHRNPANLDTRNLDITPLKDFQTMGTTENKVDPDKWRLEVTGRVKRPLILTYSQVLALPSTEKQTLLICPGFFANNGLWKGILMGELLKEAEWEDGANDVTFSASEGGYERTERFSLEEVLSGKVFLAYAVNGQALPEKHGFPLRVVAEGHYGSQWTKYVGKVKVG
ncbi:MAG TPA: molybdopterin-dependent oxidoreductase [Thermodesulfobacteriota bacterium]|nr:molybdopterin-dependent oxidoreductase [Thermodesulfobacteriota bacterium]